MKNHGTPCKEFNNDWHPTGIDETTHSDHINRFGDEVLKDLIDNINKAIANHTKLDPCTSETVLFCDKKARGFYGRENLINRALEYFDTIQDAQRRDQNSMFVIYGVSGSGKTSLVAKLMNKVQKDIREQRKKTVLITRFCGVTPMSSSAR